MLTAERRELRRGTACTPSQVTGLVLCGGRSSRMGEDKALARLGGRRLIDMALEALRPVAGRVVLACGTEPRYEELGCELALDPIPDGGPLAGLLAGLEVAETAKTEWMVALACDLPRASTAALRRLLERAAEADLDVCLLEIERGTQPLFGVYRRTCLSAVRSALEAGERRMVSFHDRPIDGRSLRVGSLRESELGGAAGEDPARNLNTPGELAAERERLEGSR